MTDLFNYNLNNYSINDIENYFNLTFPYSLNEFNYKTNDIINLIDKTNRIKLVQFLKDAKLLLYKTRFLKENPPIIIPEPKSLDKTSYIQNNINNNNNNLIDEKNITHNDLSRSNNEIIYKPKESYIISYQNDYIDGKLNPLKSSTITKSILIDTRFRDNIYDTQSSDFTFTLPLKLKKVVSLQLSAFEFPVTFYGISSSYGNNYMNISITYNITGTSETRNIIITIPDGNYNTSDLISTITTLLTANQNSDGTQNMFQYIEFSVDITTNYSGSGKTLVQTTSSNITNITLDFSLDIYGNESSEPITTKLGWNLGFIYPIYSGVELISEAIPETASIRYVYLVIDDFNNNVNDYFISALGRNALINKNIIARIPIKGSSYSLMMENDLSLYTIPRTYFGPVDINRIKIQLLDDHGRILGMNNSNYSVCLNVVLMYE